MPLYPITAIALRLFALWLLAELVLTLPGMAVLALRSPQFSETSPAWIWGLSGIALIAGLICVVLVERLARTALRRAHSETAPDLSEGAKAFLLQAGGLYFIVEAVLALPRSLAVSMMASSLPPPVLADGVGQLLELAIGLWLISAPGFWVGLFQRLRGRVSGGGIE